VNCRHVQEALSPYIDGRLTGETMLLIQHHLDGCRSCTEEYIMISEAKELLRLLPVCSPTSASERAIRLKLEYSQTQIPGIMPQSSWSPPPRGRRLVTALAMSCLGSLVVAAPFGSGTLNMMAMRPLGFSKLAHLEQKHDVTDPSNMFAPLRPMSDSLTLQAMPVSWSAGNTPLRSRTPYYSSPYMGSGGRYDGQIGQGLLVAFSSNR